MGASGAAAGIMGAGTIIGALGTIQSGAYNASMANYNASQLDASATDAVARGEEEAGKLTGEAGRLIGSQRAALAGQGIEVNSGSAAQLQIDTAVQAAKDAAQIRLNARREAMGFAREASATRSQGRLARNAATYQAAGGLLTGGAQAVAMARQGSLPSGDWSRVTGGYAPADPDAPPAQRTPFLNWFRVTGGRG